MAQNIHWQEIGIGPKQAVTIATPAGWLHILLQDDVLIQVDWLLQPQSPVSAPAPHFLQQMLTHYFANTQLSQSVKLLKQGTAFSHKVWAEMLKIPFGSTMTYAEIAKKLGTSARAVGNACRANPYPLFIPCHRVVSAAGMGGYCGQTTGEFMTIKQKLLAIEAAHKP